MIALRKLRSLCRKWNGDLVVVQSLSDVRITSRHPHGGHAIDWRRRAIFVVESKANAGAVVHEMAHVFCEDEAPNGHTDEPAWLGWEIATARLAGCYRVWSDQMSGYLLGDVLGPGERRRLGA